MIEHLTIENIFITTILLSLGVLFYITIKTEKKINPKFNYKERNIMLNIIKKLNKLISKSKKIEVETPSVFSNEKYEEIQAFVYRDLDLIKKKAAYAAYIQNLPEPLSAEAKEKIRLRKIELSRTVDKMIRANKPALDKFTKSETPKRIEINLPEYVVELDQSPIPRHPRTPKSL